MTASPDWWKDFFSGLVIPFWQGAIPDETTLADADVFAQKLALRPGSRLLDVPCGHGRFALEFARRGCRVTGVDFSRFPRGGKGRRRAGGPDDRVAAGGHARPAPGRF